MSEISRIFRSSFPEREFTGFRTAAWSGAERPFEPLYPTLLHAFAHAAKADDTTGLELVPDDEQAAPTQRSWRDLYHASLRGSVHLYNQGVKPGDRVLLVLPTSFEFVSAFFAVQMAGAIPVPSYPPAVLEKAAQALERLSLIARSAGATLCVTSARLRPILGALHSAGIEEILNAESLDAEPQAQARPRALDTDAAFIQYTSGSTGAPKGVLLTHRSVVSNIHAMGQAMRVNRHDVGVSWLPLYHDMGLIGALLTSIYWRMPLTLLSPPAFLQRPARWLETLTRCKGTLSPAPNFAYALCAKRVTPEERARLDLSSWRVAFNGAEPVNPGTVEEFARVFAPCGFRRESMLPVYGLAESSLAVSFPEPGTRLRQLSVDRARLADGHAALAEGDGAVAVTCVGRALPGHALVVVDTDGEPLPDFEVGHVVVQGPSVMAGYYGDDAATRAVLRDGTLWTGDLGFVVEGELYVTGRAKDVIIVRGRNYYAEDLERVGAKARGVRAGGVVAFGVYDEARAEELVVLVCETRLTDEPLRIALVGQVSELIAREFGIPIDEVVLAVQGTIPKTPSGKPQRSLTRARYLDGTLAPSRTGRLGIAMVFARSQAGFFNAQVKRLLRRRRAPP